MKTTRNGPSGATQRIIKKEHVSNYRGQYLKRNRERLNEYWRGYYAKNKERIKQKLRVKKD